MQTAGSDCPKRPLAFLDKGIAACHAHSLSACGGQLAQRWQCQPATYRSELQKHKIIQSMSGKGNCCGNCVMETFFGRLKNEMFYGYEKEYTSFEIFSKAIADYIDYYNNRRIQAKTKWMPPAKFREASTMIHTNSVLPAMSSKLGTYHFFLCKAFLTRGPARNAPGCCHFFRTSFTVRTFSSTVKRMSYPAKDRP